MNSPIDSLLARARRRGATQIERHTHGRVLVSFAFTLGGLRYACYEAGGRAVVRRDVTSEAIALLSPQTPNNTHKEPTP